MQYAWDDFNLDRNGTLLTRQGRQIDVSRKILDCITYLIEQRHRVVSYDELIRAIWGHDNVTNHQLSQMVLEARRAIGDDGQAQRLIRTMPRLGYRWVGNLSVSPPISVSSAATTAQAADSAERSMSAIDQSTRDDGQAPESMQDVAVSEMRDQPGSDLSREVTGLVRRDTTPTPHQAAAESSSRGESSGKTPAPPVRGALRLWTTAGLALAVLVSAAWWFQDKLPVAPAKPPAEAEADPLANIEARLWQGDIEGVRAGLMALPAEMADSADARILEIRMHIASARYDLAAQKLAVQQARSEVAADTVWRARLLTLQSTLNARRGDRSGREVFEPARDAVALLETLAVEAPKSVIGEAVSARGVGFMRLGQFGPAIRDLVRARDIQLKADDKRSAANTRLMLAHAWLRMGRLENALDEFEAIAGIFEQLKYSHGEVEARNSAVRIQIELLRWDEASANSRRSMEVSRKIADTFLRVYTIRLHALVLTNTGQLREAASLLEETDAAIKTGSGASATYDLATGNAEGALAESAAMFADYDAGSNANLILSNQEGALLLWATAAQELAMDTGAMPAPTPAQLAVLQRPTAIPGRIARGRWLWSKGMRQEAETELRRAFDESTKANRLFYMTLAAEPLIGLLLENGDIGAADAMLASLRGIDPERMDRDYRVNLLRLQTALAKGEAAEIEDAYPRVRALAGERHVLIKSRASSALNRIQMARTADGMQ